MSLNKQKGHIEMIRHSWLIALIFTAFILNGCGGSEETTQDQSQIPAQQEKPAVVDQAKAQPEQSSSDQALTSFIGEKEPEQKADQQKPVTTPSSSQQNDLALYEKQIQDLRTENTGLKQKMVKLEEDNRSLTSRLNDTEARLSSSSRPMNTPTMPAAVTPSAPVVAPVPAAEPAPVSLSSYEDALKAFNRKKYSDALKEFQSALNGGVREDMRDNCIYWIGESQFALKRYSDALKNFQDVLTIKNSDKRADAQFMLAQTYEKLGSKKKAKDAYEKVVKDYPMSKNVKRAKERWAKL